MGRDMDTEALNIGIAFNAYEAVPGRHDESISEMAVEKEAGDVFHALNRIGHRVSLIQLRRSIPGFLRRISRMDIHVLVNLCEGFMGRTEWEPNISGLLEMSGIGFTGNPASALSLCRDKFRTKAVLKSSGLPVPEGVLVNDPAQEIDLPFPVIVKPNSEDASLGIHPDSVVKDRNGLGIQINRIIKTYRQPALVESFIDGREFNVAVMEDSRLHALPVSEISFTGLPDSSSRICGYEAKWFEDHVLFHNTRPLCPAPLPDELARNLQKMAEEAFKATGCRDYARVDFRMDRNSRCFILEVNPNPDISLNAGFARALAAEGISYDTFWERIVRNTLKRMEEA